MKKTILTIIFIASYIFPALAQDTNLSVRGYLDTYHAVRTTGDWDFMTSRTRLRTEISANKDNASLFISTNLIYNPLLYSKPFLDFREGYIDYAADSWGLRAGRQIISLGVADGLQVLDLISPLDMREFLAQDYDDIRQPVDAIKTYFYGDSYKAEIIVVPTFEPFILPLSKNSAWSILPDVPYPLIILPGNKPKMKITNTEVAGRLSFNLHGADLSLIGIYGWNKQPVFVTTVTPLGLTMLPVYKRSTTLGLSASIPIDQIVLRGETAYNPDKLVTPNINKVPGKNVDDLLIKYPSLHSLVGLDWFAPNSWMLSAQISHEYFFNYDTNATPQQNNLILGTLRISKKFYSDLMEVASMGYFDLTNGGGFNRLSLSYAITDEVNVTAGYDLFYGDQGLFSIYNDNSEAFLKLKYFF